MTEKEILYEARESMELRRMTPKIRLHFETIERRMHRRQEAWGGNLSVLNEETEKKSACIRRSLGVRKILTEMPIAIEDHDMIVGNCVKDDTVIRCAFPIFLKNEELGKCTIHMSHKTPDYDTLLKKGLRELIGDLQKKIPEVEKIPFDDIRQTKSDFIEACVREAESVIEMAGRYGDLARMQAERASGKRKEELLEIAEVCSRVPEYPAATFREAVQSVWFINYALFETMTNIPIGIIDRILAPYFERDYKKGILSLAQAQELIDSFVLHTNDRAQIDPENYVTPDQRTLTGGPKQCMMNYGYGFTKSVEDDNADAINHWGQNILISGLRADGTDATSAVTYFFLNAHEKFQMTSPVLTVRMHSKTPPELMERAAQVLKTGGGMPYINNDDVIVSAYEKLGIPREDGCLYANSNCWETMIQGSTNQEMIRGINFLYFLELALNRGKSFLYAEQVKRQKKPDRNDETTFSGWVYAENSIVDGLDTGSTESMSNFEDLMKAWKIQLDYALKHSIETIAEQVLTVGSHGPLSSIPILSMLTRDCVERVQDITHGGARYNMWHLMGEAVANAADSAAAVKKLVFDEKLLSLSDLVRLLKSNWAGTEGEELRLQFINNAPKFGNDDDYVDSIAKEMVDYFVERAAFYQKEHPEILFSPCIGTYSWIISIGKRIGASAEGRQEQESIAANMSPVPGRDVNGPTAAIRSYLKLNTQAMAAGAPIDLRLSKNGLDGEEGTKRIVGLIRTFLQNEGNMMTLTITSAEELRRAMEEPEKYRGLRVRMGGWSAYYVLLSKDSQKIHLKRVEHGLA